MQHKLPDDKPEHLPDSDDEQKKTSAVSRSRAPPSNPACQWGRPTCTPLEQVIPLLRNSCEDRVPQRRYVHMARHELEAAVVQQRVQLRDGALSRSKGGHRT